MDRNVEIKARVRDYQHTARRARELASSEPVIIPQEDVFFPCPSGRLKLRILGPEHGELIFYQRPDQEGPKTSLYSLTPTSDPTGLRHVLATAYGEKAVVQKTRHLYLVGRTRIHLDRVEGLGDFLELEVVLAEEDSIEGGEAEAHRLMEPLGVLPEDLVPDAYVDLLDRQHIPGSP
ncbi:MAG: adenylate cyclase [Roseibacillus sp.]|nr:adenylate cyclase [Roseibacillus sp.]